MKRYILVAICMIFGFGLFASSNNAEKLRIELERWISFRCEGVLQLNYGVLSMRNMFVMAKKGREMRLDILSGGAWGSGGTLFSFYMGDYFSLHSPMMPNLQELDIDKMLAGINLEALPNPDILMKMFGEEVLRTRKAVIDSIQIHFNRNMQIERIRDPRSDTEVTVKYNRRGNPDTVTVNNRGKTVALLQIDEIKFGEFPIEPLPPLFKKTGLTPPDDMPEPLPPLPEPE